MEYWSGVFPKTSWAFSSPCKIILELSGLFQTADVLCLMTPCQDHNIWIHSFNSSKQLPCLFALSGKMSQYFISMLKNFRNWSGGLSNDREEHAWWGAVSASGGGLVRSDISILPQCYAAHTGRCKTYKAIYKV